MRVCWILTLTIVCVLLAACLVVFSLVDKGAEAAGTPGMDPMAYPCLGGILLVCGVADIILMLLHVRGRSFQTE